MLRSWTGSLSCSSLSAFLMSKSLDNRRPISQLWGCNCGTLGNQKYSSDCKSQSPGNRWYFTELQGLGRTCRGLKWDQPTGLNPQQLERGAEKVIILTEAEGQDQMFLCSKVACGLVRSGKYADCSWRGLLVVFGNRRMPSLALLATQDQ